METHPVGNRALVDYNFEFDHIYIYLMKLDIASLSSEKSFVTYIAFQAKLEIFRTATILVHMLAKSAPTA